MIKTGLRQRGRRFFHYLDGYEKDKAKQRAGASLLLAGMILSGCGVKADDMYLKVSPSQPSSARNTAFEGWGTTLCWWANRLGYSDALSQLAAEAFCDPVNGLGLNILRYNIGGGDDPAHHHITRTDSMMPGFWANPQYQKGEYLWDYDWNQDTNQRNVLNKCLAVSGDGMIVEAFSNSPPWFMTESGCSSGAVNPGKDNLKADAYDAFARYLADVAAHFASAWGIRFQSISPMNEPDTAYWGAFSNKQEGCHFDPGASQSRLLLALSEQLKARGLEDMLISGTDETSIDTQIHSLKTLSPEALAVIGRVDTHSYGGSRRKELRDLARRYGKGLWMSEVDGGDVLGKNAGEMGAALWLAQRIADDLNGLSPSAWIMWQVIDSHISQEGYLGRRDTGMVNVNGGYWGTAVADHDRQELILTKKYYAFGQFTRYIRPGSSLLAMSGPAVAALDENGKRLTVVVVNSEAAQRGLTLDVSSFQDTFPDGSPVRMIRTSGSMAEGENWTELPAAAVRNGTIAVSLPAYSITTFLVDCPS